MDKRLVLLKMKKGEESEPSLNLEEHEAKHHEHKEMYGCHFKVDSSYILGSLAMKKGNLVFKGLN